MILVAFAYQYSPFNCPSLILLLFGHLKNKTHKTSKITFSFIFIFIFHLSSIYFSFFFNFSTLPCIFYQDEPVIESDFL